MAAQPAVSSGEKASRLLGTLPLANPSIIDTAVSESFGRYWP